MKSGAAAPRPETTRRFPPFRKAKDILDDILKNGCERRDHLKYWQEVNRQLAKVDRAKLETMPLDELRAIVVDGPPGFDLNSARTEEPIAIQEVAEEVLIKRETTETTE